jgi:hypothetical protein
MICGVAIIAYTANPTCTNSDSCSLRNSYITLRNYPAATATATKVRTTAAACSNN